MVVLMFQWSHRKSPVGGKTTLASGRHEMLLSCPSLFKIHFLVFSASVFSQISTHKVINS